MIRSFGRHVVFVLAAIFSIAQGCTRTVAIDRWVPRVVIVPRLIHDTIVLRDTVFIDYRRGIMWHVRDGHMDGAY